MQLLDHGSFALLSTCLLTASSTLTAQSSSYRVFLDGDQEVPPVATTGTGLADVTLDTSTGAVTITGTFQNLAGAMQSVVLHGTAPIGSTAGSVLTFNASGVTTGSFDGSLTLNAQGIQDMQAGLYYIDLHTDAFPGGELRGQIVQITNTQLPAELPTDPTLADSGGTPDVGPRINSAAEPFDLALDCSDAVGPGVWLIELQFFHSATPTVRPFGNLWLTGGRLLKCAGSHSQGLVECIGGAGRTLPDDLSLVGSEYTAQGYCGNFAPNGGRTSNALVQMVGI